MKTAFVCFSILLVSLNAISLLGKETGTNAVNHEEIAGTSIATHADSPNANTWPQVVVQKDIGDMACGPCSIFNAFRFGDATLTNLAWKLPGNTSDEKVRNLIKLYGGKSSALFHHRVRYSSNDGMWDEDVVPFINDWLKQDASASLVSGEYLTLKKGQKPQKNLRQVYNELRHSLNAGFPPVLALMSYVAQKSIFHYHWNDLSPGHFVTVVGVQDTLPEDAPGFSMWVADADSGRVLETYVYAEQNHSFSALTGIQVGKNDKENDQWEEGYPFLMILSPELEQTLGTDTAKWNERTICVLEYAAHR